LIRALAANRHATAGDGEQTSQRSCVVTRAERPPEDLIRFVRAPDGAIVPDIARKLPGRGIWVTCDEGTVQKAIRDRAFERAARAKVSIDDDLVERVGDLLRKRACNQLSLANKAGLVLTGAGKVNAWIEAGADGALVQACDASIDGLAKVQRKYAAVRAARGLTPHTASLLTIDELSLAIGRSNVVHAALATGKAATNFLAAVDRVAKYRAVRLEDREIGTAPEPVDGQANAIRHTGKA